MKLTSRARRERRQIGRWIRNYGSMGVLFRLNKLNPCLLSRQVQVRPGAAWHSWKSLAKFFRQPELPTREGST